MMAKHKPTLTVVCSVLLALVVNIVLDVTTDLPVAFRWGIAILAVLMFSTVTELVSRSSRSTHPDHGRDSTGVAGPSR